MTRLIINGEDAELNQVTTIAVSKTLLDLNDLSKRGIKITNAITLPFTNINDRLCGYPSRLSSNNQAFETNPPYLLVDSNSIVSHGDVVIKSFDDKKGIKIQLAEGFSFWAYMGAKKLEDIDNHVDDFVFNSTNMDALKLKSTSVFLTALHSATGNATGTALTNYDYTRPCVNFRALFEKIISESGYEIDWGEVLTQTEIDDIGCLSNADNFFVSDFKRQMQGSYMIGNIDLSVWTSVFSKAGNVSLSTDTLTNNLYKTSYVIKGRVETAQATQITFTFGSNVGKILVPKGRSFVNFRSDEVEIGSTLVISTEVPILFEDVYVYSAISEGDIFEVEGSIDIYDYLVLSDYNLPSMTYKALIKTFLKMFFLDIIVDDQSMKISMKYLPNEIDVNNAVDLSNSVDRNYEVSSGNIYGQLNSLTYSNDEDVSKELGTTYFNIPNENAQSSKSFLNVSEFSASNEIAVSGINMIVAPIYDTIEFKRQSIANRIVYFQEVGAFGYNAVFNLISWQRLFPDHYSSFVDSTKRERSTTLQSYLTTLQFNQINRSHIIYVDFLKSHFLVTGIDGFTRKKLCKLKVIKYN